MRAGSLALRSVGAAAVLVLAPAVTATAATVAHDSAASPGSAGATARLTPAEAAPGGTVRVGATGCSGASALARSEAFMGDAELRTVTDRPALVGTARVRPDAGPGAYGVRILCDGRDHGETGRLLVRAMPVGGAEKVARTVHASPVAPVRAGGGGTAAIAMPVAAVDPEDTGPSATQTVVGLVLAGAAAVAFAVRSARRRRTDSD